MNKMKKFGFLQMCADRRFWLKTVRAFEKETGLSAKKEDFWIEASAGGAPGIKSAKTARVAYAHGAKIMGWQAHGDACGGFPNQDNSEMRKKIDAAVLERKKRYPQAKHLKIFASLQGIDITNL